MRKQILARDVPSRGNSNPPAALRPFFIGNRPRELASARRPQSHQSHRGCAEQQQLPGRSLGRDADRMVVPFIAVVTSALAMPKPFIAVVAPKAPIT
jgi:hypothetical protein